MSPEDAKPGDAVLYGVVNPDTGRLAGHVWLPHAPIDPRIATMARRFNELLEDSRKAR